VRIVLLVGYWRNKRMLAEFNMVWNVFGDIIAALPNEIVVVVAYVFCGVGIVGVFRSL